MKQLLMLVPLAVLALAAAAEAQSQAGGLPDVSARVQVLETQTKTLETRVNLLQSENTALQAALNIEVQARKAGEAEIVFAVIKETAERQAADTEARITLIKETNERKTADAEAANALNQETNERKTADAEAANALNQEVNQRKTADADLEEQFDVFGRVFAVSVPTTFLVQGQVRTVATLAPVPAGRYLVIAKANVENTIHDAGWHCILFRNAEQDSNFLDFSETRTHSGSFGVSRGNVNMVAVTTLFEPGSFRVDCFTGENGSDIFTVKIVAVSVQ